MRTALDTNILSALWSRESVAGAIKRELAEAQRDGAVLVCGGVYAEVDAHPGVTEGSVDEFLADTGIQADFHFDQAVWRLAGRRFAEQSRRRRKSGSGGTKRMLAGLLIGAHAQLQADPLMTLDVKRYKRDFPELRLLTPAE